jgi:hypothetical protein
LKPGGGGCGLTRDGSLEDEYEEIGGGSLPLDRYPKLQPRRMTLRARTPVPINSKASGANAVKEKAPPDSGSAEALLVAVALEVAVALAVEVADALADEVADELAVAVELAVALADISGQTPSGSNAVWASVPNSTLPSGLK